MCTSHDSTLKSLVCSTSSFMETTTGTKSTYQIPVGSAAVCSSRVVLTYGPESRKKKRRRVSANSIVPTEIGHHILSFSKKSHDCAGREEAASKTSSTLKRKPACSLGWLLLHDIILRRLLKDLLLLLLLLLLMCVDFVLPIDQTVLPSVGRVGVHHHEMVEVKKRGVEEVE